MGGKKKKKIIKLENEEENDSFHGFTDNEIETASLKSDRSSFYSFLSNKSELSSISSSKSTSSSKTSRKSSDSRISKSEKSKRRSIPITGSPKTAKTKRSSISGKSTKTLSSVSGSSKSGKSKGKSLLNTGSPTIENNQNFDKNDKNVENTKDISELPISTSVPSVKISSSDSESSKSGKNKSNSSDIGNMKIGQSNSLQSEQSITNSGLSEKSDYVGELKVEKNFNESGPLPSVPSNPLRLGKRQPKPSQKVRENNQNHKNRILSLGSPSVKSEESKMELLDVQTKKKSSATEDLQECAKLYAKAVSSGKENEK